MRNMTIVTAGLHPGPIGIVNALFVLLRNPLHRVARATAEVVGAGHSHHHLGRDHTSRADHKSNDHEREH